MKISFLGGAGTVTGSKYLLEDQNYKVLVDCGLFQGLKNLRLKNRAKLPFDPKDLKGVLLTHAHIDHSGYIPKLVNDGFTAQIHCTKATHDLCQILLPDSGYIQEEDARYANEMGFSKHSPALPLYTRAEAVASLRHFTHYPFDKKFELGPFHFTFHTAGHILGASFIKVVCGHTSLLFSGDLGRPHDLLMKEPAPRVSADYLIVESTYGNRLHERVDPIDELQKIVEQAVSNKSVILVPSFAVGRAQVMLYCFHKLFERAPKLKVPIFLNSPMATSVTELYEDYLELHRMDRDLCREVCSLAHFVQSPEESMNLNKKKGPMIIISSSGMITGGRILHHVKHYGPDKNNIIILPGFQAAGTRGAALVRGVERVKIHGEYVPIRAKIIHMDLFSAHADQGEILRWLDNPNCSKPKQTFIVHGEPESSDAMRLAIKDRLNYPVVVPEQGETFELN